MSFCIEWCSSLKTTSGDRPIDDIHLTPQWFELLARTSLPDGTKVRVFPLGAADDVYAPCLPCKVFSEEPRTLHSLANFYTPLFGPLGVPEIDENKIAYFITALTQENPPWIKMNLRPLDPDTLFFSRLLNGLKNAGWWADQYFCFGNWYLKVNQRSFEDYFAERSSQLRNTIIRSRKRLQKLPGYRLDIQTQSDDKLESMIADFVMVYNHSWKRPEPFPDFIPELCRLAAREGWLRLGVVRLEEQPLAAQLWLVAGGIAYIVKLAYHQDHARLSAGSVLTAALMQQVIDEDKVHEVDYLIGDDPYKRDWMSDRRERYGIIAFNPRTLEGLMSAIHHFGGRKLASYYHRLMAIRKFLVRRIEEVA